MDKVESWSKFLKIVSVICIVVYAIFTVLGIAVMASLIDPEVILETLGVAGALQGAEAALFTTIAGAVIAVAYAFQLLATIAVLRGVKNPSKMKLGVILYAIVTVVSAINLVMSIAAGGDAVSLSCTPFFVAIFMLYGSFVVYRSAK